MLGRLYITANSSAEKLQSTTALVGEAIDDKIASDASSRKALNKLHTGLTKALGEARKSQKNHGHTLMPVAEDGIDEQDVNEPGLADRGNMTIEALGDEDVTEANDSLLEELLDDEEGL